MFDDITGKKRTITSSSVNGSVSNDDDRADSASNKKRFVWPESLHLDFISAVFDTGLKFATIEEIQSSLAAEKASCSVIQLKSILQKFRIYRNRKYVRRKLFYESQGNGGNENTESLEEKFLPPLPIISDTRISDRIPHSELMKLMRGEVPITAENLEISERSCAEYYATMKDRLAKVHQAIKAQQELMDLTKQSLDEQSKLWAKANDIFDSVDKSIIIRTSQPAEELDHQNNMHAWQSRNFASSESNTNDTPSSDRADLRIMSEMRATMDLHRKLLLQHEDQLSMHDKHHHHHHQLDALTIPVAYFPHHWSAAHPPPPHQAQSSFPALHQSSTTSAHHYPYPPSVGAPLSTVTAYPPYHTSQPSSNAAGKVEIAPIPLVAALGQHTPYVSVPVTGEGGLLNNDGHHSEHHSVMPPPNRDDHHAYGHPSQHHNHNSHSISAYNAVPLLSRTISVNSQILESLHDLDALDHPKLHRAATEDTHHSKPSHPLDSTSVGEASDLECLVENGTAKAGNVTAPANCTSDSAAFDPDSFDGDALFSFLMTS